MRTFMKCLKDSSGASAAEYALILAIVGTGVAIAAFYLGEVIGTAMSETAVCLETAGGSC